MSGVFLSKVEELAKRITHYFVAVLFHDDTCRACKFYDLACFPCHVLETCSPLHSRINGSVQSADTVSYDKQNKSGCNLDSLHLSCFIYVGDRSRSRTSCQVLFPSFFVVAFGSICATIARRKCRKNSLMARPSGFAVVSHHCLGSGKLQVRETVGTTPYTNIFKIYMCLMRD